MFAMLFLALLPLALVIGLNDDSDDDSHDTKSDADTDVETGDGEEITITEPDTVTEGTDGDDTIQGTDGTDFVFGKAGEDMIFLGDGDDHGTLEESDYDAIESAQTPEEFIAALEESGYFGAVGGTGEDYIDGGHGNDAITGSQGNDTLRGNLGADLLVDYQGSNALYGGYGYDDLEATDLDGVHAPDLLDGGGNDDYLLGDDGDTMTGGTGSDFFDIIWQSGDAPVTVTDFGGDDAGTPAGDISETISIYIDSVQDVSNFEVVAQGANSQIRINDEVVAVLQNFRAEDFPNHDLYIYADDGSSYIEPVYR